MPAAIQQPAWRRLGLKLKSATNSPVPPTIEQPQEVETPSKKRTRAPEPELPVSSKKPKKTPVTSILKTAAAHPTGPLTPLLSRKKSISFTPETKVDDGDSVKQLFNHWVAEQKAKDPDFLFKATNQAFETPEPPKVEEQVDTSLPEPERRIKRVKQPKSKPAPAAKSKAKKAKQSKEIAKPDIDRPFLVYLRQFCEAKDSWKFNKNHQNHLLKHAFTLEVIPSDQIHFVYKYIRSLQGLVRKRLRDSALKIKIEDQEAGAEGFPANMGDSEKRQQEYENAMRKQVAVRTAADAQATLGYEEGVLLGLSDDAMAPRMAKRMRAEQILAELAAGGEIEESPVVVDEEAQKRLRLNDGTAQKTGRKRKQRTNLVEDSTSESDSDSSSDDSSSDESKRPKSRAGKSTTSSSSSSSSSESSSSSSDSEAADNKDDEEDRSGSGSDSSSSSSSSEDSD